MARVPTDHPPGVEDKVLGPLLLPACVAQARAALALTLLPFSPPGHREHLPGRRQLRHVRLLHARRQDPAPFPLLRLLPSASRGREPGRPSQGPHALQDGRVSEARADPRQTSQQLSCSPPAPGMVRRPTWGRRLRVPSGDVRCPVSLLPLQLLTPVGSSANSAVYLLDPRAQPPHTASFCTGGLCQHEGCTEIQGNQWFVSTARSPWGPGVWGP